MGVTTHRRCRDVRTYNGRKGDVQALTTHPVVAMLHGNDRALYGGAAKAHAAHAFNLPLIGVGFVAYTDVRRPLSAS